MLHLLTIFSYFGKSEITYMSQFLQNEPILATVAREVLVGGLSSKACIIKLNFRNFMSQLSATQMLCWEGIAHRQTQANKLYCPSQHLFSVGKGGSGADTLLGCFRSDGSVLEGLWYFCILGSRCGVLRAMPLMNSRRKGLRPPPRKCRGVWRAQSPL